MGRKKASALDRDANILGKALEKTGASIAKDDFEEDYPELCKELKEPDNRALVRRLMPAAKESMHDEQRATAVAPPARFRMTSSSALAEEGARASKDVFDQILEKPQGPARLLAALGAVAFVAAALKGLPEAPQEYGLLACALMMGMGKGGVPGSSTLASALFTLMAPPGGVNRMLALVVPVTLLSDLLVGLAYFKDAQWKLAGKLLVWCGIGIWLGMELTRRLSDESIRRAIGVIFLLLSANNIWEQLKKRRAASASSKEADATTSRLRSVYVLAPCGVAGGIASYISNNMGPMLDLYLLALSLDKYAMIGTRSAIFMSINFVKFALRLHNGDIEAEGAMQGILLGFVGMGGVVLAKCWVRSASNALFRFLNERATVGVLLLTGGLLVCGLDLSALMTPFASVIVFWR